MRIIDYDKILVNTIDIISALEFDAMRSAGKTKQNVTQLLDLYKFRELLEAKVSNTKKPVSVKKEA